MSPSQHDATGGLGRRNVAVLGRSGVGKTTLLQALSELFPPPNPGAAAADVALVPTEQLELEHRGADVALVPTEQVELVELEHRGTRIALLDTPGHPELALGRVAALRGADAVLLVVRADGGLDPFSVHLWQQCEGLPRLLVLSQLDAPGADVDEALALCQRLLGESVVALDLPVHDDDGRVAGTLDLLALTLSTGVGSSSSVGPAQPEHAELVAGLRADLLEAVVSLADDDSLVRDYLDAGLPAAEPRVLAALAQGVREGLLSPLLVTSARLRVGLRELLDVVVDALPAPQAAPGPPARTPDGEPGPPLTGAKGGPLVAEVLRAGAPALVRVWSGCLPDVAAGGLGEHRPVDFLPTGAVLAETALRLRDWPLPPPFHPRWLEPGDGASAHELRRLLERDPTIRVCAAGPVTGTDAGTGDGRRLLWSLGPAHTLAALRGTGLRTSPVSGAPAGAEPPGGYALRVELQPVLVRPLARALSELGAGQVELGPAPDDPHEPDWLADGTQVVRAVVTLEQLAGVAGVLARIGYGAAAGTARVDVLSYAG